MKRSLLLIVALAASIASAHGREYSRSEFGGWIDADKDCQDTRVEVLIEESLVPVTLSEDGCAVTAGLWVCPYTGTITNDPRTLDIDHVVPLKEAWDSGAAYWEKEKRVLYANDLDDPNHLVAVSNSANRSKGSRDPSDWLPPNLAYLDKYLAVWLSIKDRWRLQQDLNEEYTMERLEIMDSNVSIGLKINDPGDLDYLYRAIKD